MDNGILVGWDDTEYLTDEGITAFDIAEIFSSYHLGMYQPMAATSMALNYGSAQEGPTAYHATNLFIHIINIGSSISIMNISITTITSYY